MLKIFNPFLHLSLQKDYENFMETSAKNIINTFFFFLNFEAGDKSNLF